MRSLRSAVREAALAKPRHPVGRAQHDHATTPTAKCRLPETTKLVKIGVGTPCVRRLLCLPDPDMRWCYHFPAARQGMPAIRTRTPR